MVCEKIYTYAINQLSLLMDVFLFGGIPNAYPMYVLEPYTWNNGKHIVCLEVFLMQSTVK